MLKLNLMYAEIMAKMAIKRGDYKTALEYEKLVALYRKAIADGVCNGPQTTP